MLHHLYATVATINLGVTKIIYYGLGFKLLHTTKYAHTCTCMHVCDRYVIT